MDSPEIAGLALTAAVAGFVHVVSGPDHLAAVAPLAAADGRRSWRVGARWGLGHGAGVVLVGLTLLGLRSVLPLDAVSAWSERLVGVVLIGVGLWGIRRAWQLDVHTHPHVHGPGEVHHHVHVHHREAVHEGDGGPHGVGLTHPHAALGVGVLHGLAGSSHLLGVLPALALPSPAAAVGWLLAFGIGTVLGMAAFAAVAGRVAERAARSGGRAWRGFMTALGGIAVAVGVYWLGV